MKKAEQYVTSIVDLPQDLLTALPTADNPDGGPCPRPLIPGHLTAACVTFDDGVIWRDESLLALNRVNVYRHEVCHLYEARVLGMSDHQHVGWFENMQ